MDQRILTNLKKKRSIKEKMINLPTKCPNWCFGTITNQHFKKDFCVRQVNKDVGPSGSKDPEKQQV